MRLVGVALGADGAERLVPWLEQAAEAGADVALIGPGARDRSALPGRDLGGRGPGALARALDAEDQLRPIDALVLAGRRERRRSRLAPRAVRGKVEPLDPALAPAEAVRTVQRATRPAGAT